MDPLTRACRSGFTAEQLLYFFRDFIKPRLFPQAVVWWVTYGDTAQPVLCLAPERGEMLEWPIRDALGWTHRPADDQHGLVAIVKSLLADKGTPEESRWLIVPEWVSQLVPPAQRLMLQRRDKARQDGAVLDHHQAVRMSYLMQVLSSQYYRTYPLAQIWHIASELCRGLQGTPLDVVECFGEDLDNDVRL